MFLGNNEISDYIDDIPMNLTNEYKPMYFHFHLPSIICINENELKYDFTIEKDALEIANITAKEQERRLNMQSTSLQEFNRLADGCDSNLGHIENTVDDLSVKSGNLILRRNSVPNNLNTFQDFGILRPQPPQYNCDFNNTREEYRTFNRIDPADFESSSSSPFDDALLKAIDEKQELNRVFQHL